MAYAFGLAWSLGELAAILYFAHGLYYYIGRVVRRYQMEK
jgi:hypothetical protein